VAQVLLSGLLPQLPLPQQRLARVLQSVVPVQARVAQVQGQGQVLLRQVLKV
jgi:hypothetical protein